MSDMNFPSSPNDGDEYRKWVYDASSSSWVVVGVGVGGFDSNSVIGLVDSDFVNSLVDFPDTQVLNNTDSLAEGITNLYYTTARQDSDTLFQVDSAYVQARQEVSASLEIIYSSNPPDSVGTEIGDEHFVTSDGTSGGIVSDGYIWNGSSWTNQLSTIDASGSANDF